MSDLLKINVNEHTEKKNGLTYLSWAWAWAEVLKIDPRAQWWPMYFGAETAQTPYLPLPGDTMMVGVRVVLKGLERSCLLPVMDHRNKAIKTPDAMAVNTALMRCLAKCIAMHGLGLYIYAGEDLPESDEPEAKKDDTKTGGVRSLTIKSTDGAGASLSAERKAILEECALYLVDCHRNGDDASAIRVWYAEDTCADNDERIYLWSLLSAESKLRATIKASKPAKEATP